MRQREVKCWELEIPKSFTRIGKGSGRWVVGTWKTIHECSRQSLLPVVTFLVLFLVCPSGGFFLFQWPYWSSGPPFPWGSSGKEEERRPSMRARGSQESTKERRKESVDHRLVTLEKFLLE